MSLDHIREQIMLATLPYKNWSEQALRVGAVSAGYDLITLKRAFPNGVRELIDTFYLWSNRQMLQALAHHDLSLLGMTERIALALRVRLQVLEPYKEAVRHLIGYLLLPPHGTIAARGLYRTVDHIWYAVGDRSTDFSFYSKRATLVPILLSVTLYWLKDTSEDMHDTSSFIDRSLKSFLKTMGLLGRITRIPTRFPDPFRFIHRLCRVFKRDEHSAS